MKRKVRTIKRRKYRHLRIRRKISGTGERPRLCVFRSSLHFEAQLIDDLEGRTLVSASTRDKNIRKIIKKGSNVDAAKTLGQSLADKAKKAGIQKVVFDRSGYLFKGRVLAFAQSARQSGLNF